MQREVEIEWLDVLDAGDARARRTRADLRRINAVMASASIALAALDRAVGAAAPRTILELGAGDGSLMARVAARRRAHWPGVQVTLLDRQPVVAADRLAHIRAAGWQPHVVTDDALDWLERKASGTFDVVFANLFVHHFVSDALTRLLRGVAAHAAAVACCEPRRARVALAASHLVALVGAGDVARHDAVSSVHAGFAGKELSALWPDGPRWSMNEYEAGLFTHCFVARRAS